MIKVKAKIKTLKTPTEEKSPKSGQTKGGEKEGKIPLRVSRSAFFSHWLLSSVPQVTFCPAPLHSLWVSAGTSLFQGPSLQTPACGAPGPGTVRAVGSWGSAWIPNGGLHACYLVCNIPPSLGPAQNSRWGWWGPGVPRTAVGAESPGAQGGRRALGGDSWGPDTRQSRRTSALAANRAEARPSAAEPARNCGGETAPGRAGSGGAGRGLASTPRRS